MPTGTRVPPGEVPAGVETDPPDIGDETQLPPQVRAIMRQPVNAARVLEQFNARREIATKILANCLDLTKPADWVVMKGGRDQTDPLDSKVYLQEGGAERVAGMIGFATLGEPAEERITLENGGYAYTVRGWAMSTVSQTVQFVVGGRSSDDRFFDKFDEEGNRLPPDTMDVWKAAWANFKNRAVSALGGLRGLTVRDLKNAGIDTTRCRGIVFGSGTAGGKEGAGMTLAPDGFGPDGARGKPWTEIAQDHLVWYIKSFEKSIGDKAKARWKASNQSMLDAAKAEYQRRLTAAEAPGKEKK